MSSDDKKNWGTIFLDATRESSLSRIDAMQAASRQEQWNKKTQQDYLEKVRQKAIDRAKEILGEAYTERQNILAEAEHEAERIRQEARAAQQAAEEIRNQSQELRHAVQVELDDAQHIKEGAHEEGFQAGLAQAQEELQNFRAAMGSSVAGVLRVIEGQTLHLFCAWRAELVDLLRVCVEKGTSIVLNEERKSVLEGMMLKAVRNLDQRRSVVLRVNPEDEPVVTDLIAAAKESNPELGQWDVSSDLTLQPGDIIAESSTGTVDSRLDLFREMVENIIQHLSLPETEDDIQFFELVQRTLEEELARVAALTPPPVNEEEVLPEEPVEELPVEEPLPEVMEEPLPQEEPQPEELAAPMTPEQMAFQMRLQKAESVPTLQDMPEQATAGDAAYVQGEEGEEPSDALDAVDRKPRARVREDLDMLSDEEFVDAMVQGVTKPMTEAAALEDIVHEAEHAEQQKKGKGGRKGADGFAEPSMEELEDELLGDDEVAALPPSLDDFAQGDNAPSLDDFAGGEAHAPSLDDFAADGGPSLDDFAADGGGLSLDDFAEGEAPSLDNFDFDSLDNAGDGTLNFDDLEKGK